MTAVQPIRQAHPLYDVWTNMVARCTRVTHLRYENYGGRGIRVHPPWLVRFDVFVHDVEKECGKRPHGKGPSGRSLYSFDRIDNDGHYAPGNIRWATAAEQRCNQRLPRPHAQQCTDDELISEMNRRGLSL